MKTPGMKVVRNILIIKLIIRIATCLPVALEIERRNAIRVLNNIYEVAFLLSPPRVGGWELDCWANDVHTACVKVESKKGPIGKKLDADWLGTVT
jgi:hypothetical protein